MANFRPLQPAPMEEQPPNMQARPLPAMKPKRTVTLGACVACKSPFRVCDGNRPVCSCCAQKDTHCVYELGPNEKPSQAMKRKNEEMQGELSDLRQIYDLLRLRPQQEALAILRKIREGSPEASPAQQIQLINFLHQGQLTSVPPLAQNSGPAHSLTLPPIRLALDSPSSKLNILPSTSILPLGYDEVTSQRRRHASDTDVSARSDASNLVPPPTSIDSLLHPKTRAPSDPRLAHISSWTPVTKDTRFLALLMTLWHKWEYSYYHYLDWDIFLDDLSSGRTDFCSELLVNAVLASASFHSSLVKNRSKPFGDSLITRFYWEARRLWEAGEGEDSLTRVQAALALFMVFGKHGRDRVGYMFLQEACRITRTLGLFRLPSSATQRPQHITLEKWERARSVTAWALFNFQLTMSFTYSLTPLVNSPPPVAIPYEGTDNEDLFQDECARSVVLLECLNTLIDPDDPTSDLPPKPEQIEILYLRLKLWYDHRRSSLCPTKHPSPENLLTAMQYYVSVIRLFQPFTHYESSNERISSYRDQALQRTSAATKELRHLISINDSQHGWAATITIILHPLTISVFGSLDEIACQTNPVFTPEANEAYKGLLTCLYGLSVITTYNFYSQSLFRLATQSCKALDIPLPPEITTVLDRFQSDEWTKTAASMVSSQYIADMRGSTSGMENARMDSIISKWDAMTIKEGPASMKKKKDGV
ncbi:C6 transcription factor [Paraphaeosphaeria minitans]|uniref:C6 transcription factor n=1 Tax=Paraphaeosphaeria minitans TaxID=565426 RepID=A0A9P6GKK4_9PLEO|nr:C6 transcription factor [Paraphaeosphaeria minitans]